MEWTASRLIPTILGGGVVIGLLASTAINTRPKDPPEPPWRLAAREVAFKPASYAVVGQGPEDLSPHLPWIGTGPDGSVAPMPEDFYRGRIIPIRIDDYAVIQEPIVRSGAIETGDYAIDERPAAIRDEVDEPSDYRAADIADEPRFKSDGLQSSLNRPPYSEEPDVADDEADLGG